jgi:hypothetical protein
LWLIALIEFDCVGGQLNQREVGGWNGVELLGKRGEEELARRLSSRTRRGVLAREQRRRARVRGWPDAHG